MINRRFYASSASNSNNVQKLLNQDVIDQLDKDIQKHEFDEQNHLIDWLMASQLSKDKKLISLIESWEKSSSKLQRRVFWYYQARLRWIGNTNQSNTEYLLDLFEKRLIEEEPEVQWSMNYTAGQIGKWQKYYRDRCIAIGEETDLYKDEMVAKNFVPSYLPKFIQIEVAKLKKNEKRYKINYKLDYLYRMSRTRQKKQKTKKESATTLPNSIRTI